MKINSFPFKRKFEGIVQMVLYILDCSNGPLYTSVGYGLFGMRTFWYRQFDTWTFRYRTIRYIL